MGSHQSTLLSGLTLAWRLKNGLRSNILRNTVINDVFFMKKPTKTEPHPPYRQIKRRALLFFYFTRT
jgi:hypothetical protein